MDLMDDERAIVERVAKVVYMTTCAIRDGGNASTLPGAGHVANFLANNERLVTVIFEAILEQMVEEELDDE